MATIIPRKITQDMADLATFRAEAIEFLPYNSIRYGKGINVGCYGEVVIEKYIGGQKEVTDFYNFDCIWNDLRFEVKSVECNTPPLPHYMCSVAASNDTQKCDYYAFTRVMTNRSYGYVMGFMSSERFKKEALYFPANDIDESNGHVVSAPCWKVSAAQCQSFEEVCLEVFK